MSSTFDNSALALLLDNLWTCANNTAGRPFGTIFDTSNGNLINGSSGTMKWVFLVAMCQNAQSDVKQPRAGWFICTPCAKV